MYLVDISDENKKWNLNIDNPFSLPVSSTTWTMLRFSVQSVEATRLSIVTLQSLLNTIRSIHDAPWPRSRQTSQIASRVFPPGVYIYFRHPSLEAAAFWGPRCCVCSVQASQAKLRHSCPIFSPPRHRSPITCYHMLKVLFSDPCLNLINYACCPVFNQSGVATFPPSNPAFLNHVTVFVTSKYSCPYVLFSTLEYRVIELLIALFVCTEKPELISTQIHQCQTAQALKPFWSIKTRI